ncbi:MAG: folylpolyglutamate synthase/dihydrofolate synthase family protein [Candidatus Omnitrophota bacterium]
MTCREVVKYLDSFIDYEKSQVKDYRSDFKLERTRSLLSSLEDPQKMFKIIHVAGTKGKGSTAAFIASILKEEGLRVGLYTSPHLISFCERIRVDGEMIGEDTLSRIIADSRPHFEKLRDQGLSFFEVYTAAAFLYFKEMLIDIAVMETGLGGRLDATNAAQSIVSVITPISIEHAHILGDTLGRIAYEKAGIIKKGSICISAPQDKEALDVIEDRCSRTGVGLSLVGRDIKVDGIGLDKERERFNVRTVHREYRELETTLLGRHQVVNAATAIGAVEALGKSGISISEDSIRIGIARTNWPGRMEIIERDPFIVLDGAQNTASAKALIEAMKRRFGDEKFTLILGISKDKDIKGICEVLSAETSRVVLTRARTPRAADPEIIKEYIDHGSVEIIPDSKDALRSVLAKADKKDVILVAGSLYLVGEIRENLIREELKQLK